MLACLSVLPWSLASAAPWVQPEESYYARTALSHESLEGNPGWRGDLYIEYGLTKTWTVTSKTETVRFSDAPLADGDGLQLNLRRELYRGPRLSVTAEIGALQGRAIVGNNGCDTPGIELRTGAGWSQKLFKQDAYFTGELVRREHEACARNRFEFGTGRKLSRSIWLSSQVWIERGTDGARSDKIQTEFLWRNGRHDYALGTRQETGGLFEETSVYAAYATRF